MFECDKIRSRKFMQYAVVILAVLAMAAILFFIRMAIQTQGNWVIVTLNGEEKARYRLMENGSYRIAGEGMDYNELVIENGEAFIVEANCKNQVCVHSKAISHTGETITCLPHRMQITIEGGGDSDYDAITN